jgi:hypothetical protein
MNQLTYLKSLILIPLALGCFSLAPKVIAMGIPLSCNTSDGFQALFNLTTGTGDTAVGGEALFSNTTGSQNTAVGCGALEFNLIGGSNTAIGSGALKSNVNGVDNTATGSEALRSNVNGGDNTATGSEALKSNTSGHGNTAVGALALKFNTAGSDNTAIGGFALANISGTGNIALGAAAGFDLTTGSNNIDIGNRGVNGETNTIRIGTQGIEFVSQTATFIAGISRTTVVGSPVFVTSDGQLGVGGALTSSARFKDEIKPMDKVSEAILALKPVTFRYKKELDPKGSPQFGLVAEEVEKVNADLITRDRDGKPYTVRYDAVNAMLLHEFLKEHRTVQELKTTVAQQQKQIETLTAGLQKVSAQLEVSKAAPQTVLNNQ